VDVISHLAFGRALAALAHRRAIETGTRTRALTAALIVGSITPDADAILMPFGWDRYLVWHERGTHTLLGVALGAALLASLLRFVIQPLLRRPRTPWRLLWLASLAGCMSHLLLDAVCGGSLHPLWPLSDARLTFSLVAMADPLLAAPLLLFLIAALVWRRRAFTLAIGVMIAMTAVLATKALSRHAALRAYERAFEQHRDVPAPSARTIEARWSSLTQWYVYDRVDTRVRAWLVDARTGEVHPYIERPTIPAGAALIDASRHLDTVRRCLSLFEFTFPEIRDREDGTVDVLWTDIRFCRLSQCDLWFGGRFDHTGHPLEQVVLIGTVRQTRLP